MTENTLDHLVRKPRASQDFGSQGPTSPPRIESGALYSRMRRVRETVARFAAIAAERSRNAIADLPRKGLERQTDLESATPRFP